MTSLVRLFSNSSYAFAVWLALVAVAPAHPVHAPLQIEFPLVSGFEDFYVGDDDPDYLADGGEILLGELNCVACHAPPEQARERLAPNPGPLLAGVGSRLTSESIHQMIRYPRFVKMGTRMPTMLNDKEVAPAIVEALTHYLATLKDPALENASAGEAAGEVLEGDDVRGQQLYHEVGCVACHMPDANYLPEHWADGVAAELPGNPSAPIQLAGVYRESYLARFLENPLESRPAGRMPDLQLTPQEVADVAKYLKTGPTPSPPFDDGGFVPDPELVKKGRVLFGEHGCASCHDTGDDKTKAGGPPPSQPAKPLLELDAKAKSSCLSLRAQPGGIPFYRLDVIQRKAITLAIERLQGGPVAPLSPAKRVERRMTALNCYSCHSRDERGGMELARDAYLTVNNPAAEATGQQGRLPPPLTHVGRKLTRAWMEKVLFGEEDGYVRPYMSVRMPAFGKKNLGALIDDFAAADRREPPVEMDVSGLERHQRSHYGLELMGVGGLGCVTCHGLKDAKSLGPPAINLTRTVERLQPGYFKELLLDPQEVTPGTLMPPLFMGRAKAEQEVEQIWTYLKEVDQGRLPDGLLREGAFELLPEENPILFRTFLEGAGFQAIAVGFPEGLNVAFDSLEVRWALAWKGRFLDAMGTWADRFAPPAQPLGEDVKKLRDTIPFALLLKPDEEWPKQTGESAGYVFRGYRIGDDGVPVFLYDVVGLRVEDRLAPDETGKKLLRRVTIKGDLEGMYFEGLAAEKDAGRVEVKFKDGEAVIEEVLAW